MVDYTRVMTMDVVISRQVLKAVTAGLAVGYGTEELAMGPRSQG